MENENNEYVTSDNISINNIEENFEPTDDQTPEYDKYRNLLNIFNDIELAHTFLLEEIPKINEGMYSFTEWVDLIDNGLLNVTQDLYELSSNNNDINEIRSDLTTLAAIIVSWLEAINNV